MEEIRLTKTEIHRLYETKINFGVPPIIGNHYLNKISEILLENDLHNAVNLISGGSQELFQMLRSGRLSLSLVASTTPIQDSHFDIELLTQKKFVIVVSPNHPLADRKSIHFSELKDESFVMFNERFIHNNALNVLSKQNDFKANVVYRSNDLNILKGMIKQNIGISFLTEIALTKEDRLISIPLEDDIQPSFLISLVKPATITNNPSVEHITEIIRRIHLD